MERLTFGCEFEDCLYSAICPKDKGIIKNSVFLCDFYRNKSNMLKDLKEKYDNNNDDNVR